jgi:16S rRNA (cytosine1402-N4)-methyltransferase
MTLTTNHTPSASDVSHHQPVMVDQVIDIFFKPDETSPTTKQIIMDGTVGGGGHTQAILERLSPGTELYCFDRDPNAINLTQARIQDDPRAKFIQDSYSDVDRYLEPETVSAVLLDLGLSSDQLESARGFAFSQDSSLDMRFDPTSDLTAHQIINRYSIERMREIFFKYGEEPLSPRIARRIAEVRQSGGLRTTSQLVAVIGEAVPARFRTKAIARIFQAIRIEVNAEIDLLEQGLVNIWKVLKVDGILCVISYHSIEDRRMKRFVVEKAKGCTCPPKLPMCVCGKKPSAKILTSSALRPTAKEMRLNPRSRSARLRAAVKIAAE